MTRLNTSDNRQVPPACISKGFLVIFKLKSLNTGGPHLIIPVIKRSNNVKVPDHEITTVLSLIVWRVRNVSSHGRACVTFQPAPHHHWQSNSPTLLMISFSLTGLGVGELLQLTIIVVTDWSLEEGGQQVERIIIWGADIIRQTPGFTFYLRVNPPVIKTWWSEVVLL